MADSIINHDEALSLAIYKSENSNLARCYLAAIDALRRVRDDINGHGELRPSTMDAIDAVLNSSHEKESGK